MEIREIDRAVFDSANSVVAGPPEAYDNSHRTEIQVRLDASLVHRYIAELALAAVELDLVRDVQALTITAQVLHYGSAPAALLVFPGWRLR